MNSPYDEPKFTPREQQVLNAILQGKQTKRIAQELNIAPRTVKEYREHIRWKTGANSNVALFSWAAKHGYFSIGVE